MPNTESTERRIKAASDTLARPLLKLHRTDPELAKRLERAIATEVEGFRREGR